MIGQGWGGPRCRACSRGQARGSLTIQIVRRGTFLDPEAKILENWTITQVVIRISGRAKAKHAFTLLIFESFFPSTKMLVETLARQGLVCVLRNQAEGVRRGRTTWCQFAILTDRTLPRVLVIIGALLANGLERHLRERVAAEAKLLDHSLVPGD
jgi:hypothetical protein